MEKGSPNLTSDQPPFPEELAHLRRQLARLNQLEKERTELIAREQQARQLAALAGDRIRRLQAVTEQLARTLSSSEVNQVIVTQGIAALGASAGVIALFQNMVPATSQAQSEDDAGERAGPLLEIVAAAGYSSEEMASWRYFPVNAPMLLARAVCLAQPIFLTSIEQSLQEYPSMSPTFQEEARAAIPLWVEGQVVGALGLRFAETHQFDEDERFFILTLARQYSLALERSRLYEAESKARQEAETARHDLSLLAQQLDLALAETSLLHTISTTAAGEADLGRILVVALQQLSRLINFTGGSIALVEGDELVVKAAVGPFATEVLGQRMPRHQGQGRSWQLIQTGQPFISNDLQAENVKATSPIHSYIAVALSWQGRIFGLFEVDSFQTNAFKPADLILMQKVGTALSGPIELAQRYTAEVKAVAQAEEARQRLNFLAQASEVLASSLDYETTLAAVVKLAVPYLADWCSLDIEDPSGVVKRVATAHPVPAKQRLAHQFLELFPYTPEQFARLKTSLSTGQALFASKVGEAYLRGIARNEDHYKALKELDMKSTMLVPLIARGQLIGAFTLAITESERYYSEADLSLAEELARRSATAIDNARLYQEAQKVIEAQKELDQLKDQFLSIAGHELRTPLTSIKGYAQLLEKLLTTHRSFYWQNQPASEHSGGQSNLSASDSQPQLAPPKLIGDVERSLRIVSHIQQQSNRMNELIREMLDVSRIQNGRLELIYKSGIDLVKLAQRVIEQQSFSDSHKLILQTTQQVIPATVDEGRVEQVLTNLTSNALKYSQNGSEIVIGLELRRLEKKKSGKNSEIAESREEQAVIWVKDHGQGILPEDQPYLFDRFYRVRSHENARVEGLGLGLYISHEIVKAHGGQMWIESHLGQGSTFYFSLPLEP